MTPLPSFSEFFKALWDYEPFPWQTMLAERISSGSWPSALDLPTASGKTACMDVAIWSLAQQADRPVSLRSAPRRIWFVVDRRIVVDEAYDRATRIAEKLKDALDGSLKAIADRLRQVSGTDRTLAVARLRGGILRDDGWARIPSQPAIITSTVDQLGSRLFFRGYGRSHLVAPIFAGLAVHDSLILLDEAHCSVPFLQSLRAVERFRGRDWAERPIETPFAFAILSATPPQGIPHTAVFPGHERDKALDHPVLHNRMKASKPAELVVLKTKRSGEEDPLISEASRRARSFVEDLRKQRVAVIVNRVRTAMDVAAALRKRHGDAMHIVLLTGRLRPFERDRLVERWKPVLKAREPQDLDKPIVLVSTQCIEVGADFSFDALITEAASLDALRQRFGRVSRMGNPVPSPAAILIREEDTKADRKDPIYGAAIAACWQMLEGKTSTGDGKNSPMIVDFGMGPLNGFLADIEDLSPYLAPTPQAPILLPAHLDLLCQTSPIAHPEPDIQLFLHGTDRGAAEVRVIWRADLDPNNTESWEEVVALCPPVGGETLSLPLHQLRQWLSDSGASGDVADVEGAVPIEWKGQDAIQPVLVWAGRERSRLVRRASGIKPNDVVVMPAEYGIYLLGQSEPAQALGRARLDLWEVASLAGGRPAALRLNRSVIEPWLDCPAMKELISIAADPACEREALEDAIEVVLEYQPATADDPVAPPPWICDLLRTARHGRTERHPNGGLVLFGRRSDSREDTETDLFADDDDLLSASHREVSLSIHSDSVRRAVQKIASRCLVNDFLDPLQTAAYWHDVGKLDERFQVLLRQGDELAALDDEPLAKSVEIPSSPARRRVIRAASKLPRDFRHEMLSLQLAKRYAPLPEPTDASDLILHLVGSHHGYGRPFAPICQDSAPPAVRGSHDGLSIEVGSAERSDLPTPHTVASGISDRFWRLTRRYGWWGLAYLEAILRLGDWYGSRVIVAESSGESPVHAIAPRRSDARAQGQPVELSGIDGVNPLGYLAALGVLTTLHGAGHCEARLHWRRSATWLPVLYRVRTTDSDELARILAEALRGKDVTEDAEGKRKEAQERYDRAKKAVKDKLKEIKERGLRGKDRKAAIEAEVAPLEVEADRCRQKRQLALREAVPRPELAIGKHIDCTDEEYRDHAEGFLKDATISDREALDFLASFATDACLNESDTKRNKRILAPTPFCFISGSGHQYFLDTIRQLMKVVSAQRIRETLFEPWRYEDEKLSMRWDPVEDRRYALMDRDPTAADNKSRTVWMANLLAYRALTLFPSAPSGGHLATTAWNHGHRETAFTWPLWRHPAGPDTIRSMLCLAELGDAEPDRRALRARGIEAIFRARRIRVGAGSNVKINFSPGRSV